MPWQQLHFRHTLREGKACANFLAKKGSSSQQVTILSCPDALVPALMQMNEALSLLVCNLAFIFHTNKKKVKQIFITSL